MSQSENKEASKIGPQAYNGQIIDILTSVVKDIKVRSPQNSNTFSFTHHRLRCFMQSTLLVWMHRGHFQFII